jgi:hypothetical protein
MMAGQRVRMKRDQGRVRQRVYQQRGLSGLENVGGRGEHDALPVRDKGTEGLPDGRRLTSGPDKGNQVSRFDVQRSVQFHWKSGGNQDVFFLT